MLDVNVVSKRVAEQCNLLIHACMSTYNKTEILILLHVHDQGNTVIKKFQKIPVDSNIYVSKNSNGKFSPLKFLEFCNPSCELCYCRKFNVMVYF